MPRKPGGWRQGRRGGGNSGKNVLAGPSLPFISWAACRDRVFPPLSPLADQMEGKKSYNPTTTTTAPSLQGKGKEEGANDRVMPTAPTPAGRQPVSSPASMGGQERSPSTGKGNLREVQMWSARGTMYPLHGFELQEMVTGGPGEHLPRVPLCPFVCCARPFRDSSEQIA